MELEEKRAVYKNCMNIVAPLRHLYGLKSFHAHISDPMWYYEGESLEQQRTVQALEMEAETRAIGVGYNAFADGKSENSDSRWLEDYSDRIVGH
jgi:hypothetical protein